MWTPILTKQQEADLVARALHSVATALVRSEIVRPSGPSLSRGSAGVSVLYAYLSQVNTQGPWHALASEWLAYSTASGWNARGLHSLFGGLTGVSWAIEHLSHFGIAAGYDLRVQVDGALLRHVSQLPWRGEFDLVSGLVGYGLYALERHVHPTGRLLLTAVVDRLAESATYTEDGATWWSSPEFLGDWQRKRHPQGYVDLGLAHGISGAIAFLGQACAIETSAEKARPLLGATVNWLFAHRNRAGSLSSFANRIPKGSEPDRSYPRIAWCSGDLGLSAALYQAAMITNEATWAHQALEIARAAARRPLEQSGIRDAGMCHGAAGGGHVFNRFYQATGEQVFLDAARAWFRRVLALYHPRTGVGGFQAWRGAREPAGAGWGDLPGLIEGAAGIALALLAATTAVEPLWDRILAVTLPSRD